jgi:hypothetical protein
MNKLVSVAGLQARRLGHWPLPDIHKTGYSALMHPSIRPFYSCLLLSRKVHSAVEAGSPVGSGIGL